jgi:TFIIF-interacting CTD phosphatase-like protein
VFDFIYQIYQIGVNNFSDNLLFKTYALEDLAQILKVKIFLFEIKTSSLSSSDEVPQSTIENEKSANISSKTSTLKIYESKINLTEKSFNINDYIFLSFNTSLKIKYKFLLPKVLQSTINETLLSPSKRNHYYMHTKITYSNYMLVLSSYELHIKVFYIFYFGFFT